MGIDREAAESGTGPVVLVGLMGSGKSTVGRLLAASLGRALIDVDEVIEREMGRSVGELWRQGGEVAYRELERQAVLDALTRVPPVVLAAPAGVLDDPDLVEQLERPEVFVAFLRGRVATLAARIASDDQERPLVGVDPAAVLHEQAAHRNPRYEKLAAVTIDLDGRSPDELANAVLEAVRPAPG